MTTDVMKETNRAADRGIGVIRWLLIINLALVALQPLSAGFLLSGYEGAVTVHRAVALALQAGTVIQAITAVVLWLRHRVPGWVVGLSAALFVVVFLQIGLGFVDWHWLHVPVGVAVVGWMSRQMTRLNALRR